MYPSHPTHRTTPLQVDWLYDQANPTKVKSLGAMCEKISTQLRALDVLDFSYNPYHFDNVSEKLKQEGKVTPIDDPLKWLGLVDQICGGLSAAAKDMLMEKGPAIQAA